MEDDPGPKNNKEYKSRELIIGSGRVILWDSTCSSSFESILLSMTFKLKMVLKTFFDVFS